MLWNYLTDSPEGPKAREFAQQVVRPVADELDAQDLYPVDLVEQTAQQGWNSLTLPVQYGGGGEPMEHALAVFEELGAASGLLAVSLISIFQSSKIIELYGSESLKERMLPRYAAGLRASYALTEAGRGSDITSLATKATKTDSGWVLNGRKAFITSGSKADFFVVLAETEVGVSAFAVERGTEGLSTHDTPESQTFGMRNGPHLDLVLEDVELPPDALIGVEGKGLRQAMVTLSHSRTLASGICLGIARAAFDDALAYVRERSAFGGKIIDFQGIQWYFADAAAEIDAARLLTYQAAGDLDKGADYQRSSSSAKLLASTLATKVASMGVQVCGAHGTRVNASFGRYLRDAKVYEIGGGSVEILRNTIAKSILRAVDQAEAPQQA